MHRARRGDARPRTAARPGSAASPPVRSTARRAAPRAPVPERRCADASKQSNGPPVSIAGDAFMTLPPIVPWARVACDPTIAEASASAVNRSRIGALARSRSCVTSAPSRRPPSAWAIAAKAVDPVDRHDRVRQRCLALSRADHQVGPAGHRPRTRPERRERVLHRRRRRERARHASRPLGTRPDALGGHRQPADLPAEHLRDRVGDRARGRDLRRLTDALRAARAGSLRRDLRSNRPRSADRRSR